MPTKTSKEREVSTQEEALIRLTDLVDNPTVRVPVCLCLDVSGSMVGEPIRELTEGIRLFYDAIREDEVALYAAEICIVAFGGDQATKIEDFSNIERQSGVPELAAYGATPMGEGVNTSLDLLERRKQEYNDRGVDYYQPWLVLMTDGAPNGSQSELERAIARTTDLVRRKKLTVFSIGIGSNADMSVLQRFSPNRQPLKLRGLAFREFFSWLSKSVSTTSQSTQGTVVPLDVEGLKGWATL
jgi:uncharacterized protein YegL